MNLAIRDIRYRLGRFLLTALGLGLLLATVMAMGGIYRGMVEDALSIVRAPGVDLWVVQKDTNGPFAETSRIPEDVYRVIRAVPGVREASPIAFQSLQLRVGPKPFRVQLVGHRPGGLGAPPAVVAGRPIVRSRYEMLIDRKAGLPLGTEIEIGRMTLTVVGLTEGIVSNAGDPAAFVSLQDAQEIQFLKANEAIRNERARLEADLKAEPALATVPAPALAPILQDTHLANAILVRLEPWADPGEVTQRIERWNHYRAMTTAEQEEVLAKSVIERARQQILLFRTILLAVSTVIIALIIYTMTLEKTRDIATLKVIGAPDWKIGSLILQESLTLGLLGFGVGAILIGLAADYFPRRVAILPFDQHILLGIVVGICFLASVLGIRRALSVDPTTALGGGA
ncbi:MAG: ABC transporter permease [candidate division NC10 bacterium]|nr:ABC transporter permease [candidate division NC10 bacterium]